MLYVSYESDIVKVFIGWETVSFLWIVRFFPSVFLFKQIKQCHAACVLRGNIDASEYKSVVLGLIFLKYISDRFDEKHQQLVEEGDGFEEDVDEYISEGIFFVPETARWSVIASKAHTAEIGTVIDDAMRAIEKENRRLKDILPKNFARPELDKRRLGDVVDLFTNIKMVDAGSSRDSTCLQAFFVCSVKGSLYLMRALRTIMLALTYTPTGSSSS